MALSKEIVSKFVKSTKDDTKSIKKESFVHGMLSEDGKGVIFDGSNIVTPASITTNVNVKQPVTVMIKNHQAVVIGNATSDITINEDKSVANSTAAQVSAISDDDINALWK